MRCFVVCLLAACLSYAQQEAPSDRALLAKIKARMSEDLLRLPNYTCGQTIERSQRRAANRPFEPLDKVRLEVALVEGKEMFGWPDDNNIAETDLTNLVAGAGALSNGSFALLAKTVFGSSATEFEYKAEEDREGMKCVRYDYRVPVAASGYHLRMERNDAVVGYHGTFWANAETLDVLRLEVYADGIPGDLGLKAASDSMDYARVRIGTSDFLLPRSSELLLTEASGVENRNQTHFHGCRQYAGESVLSFGEPSELAAAAPPPPVPEAQLPNDFQVDIALETRISAASAVGDPVRAKLLHNIRDHHKLVIHKGAVLTGHLTRLHRDAGIYHVGISFTRIESEGAHADLDRRQNVLFMSGGLLDFRFHTMQSGFHSAGPSQPGQISVPAERLNLKPGFRLSLRSRLLKSE